MKLFAILLGFLWLSHMSLDVMLVVSMPHPFLMVVGVANVVLLSLCLAGAVELGFRKRIVRLSRKGWRITFNCTFVLGGFYVLLKNYGELLGMPGFAGGDAGLFQAALDFLPYVLFALPVVILEHEYFKRDQENA